MSEKEILTFFSSLPKLVRPDYIDADNRRALELMTSSEVTIEDIMYDVSYFERKKEHFSLLICNK